MRTRSDVIVVLLASACSGVAAAQSFLYTAQERSVHARAGSVSQSTSAPNFAPWVNAIATAISGRETAASEHTSRLDLGEVYFSGQVRSGPTTSATTNAKGVFDVTFTLSAATQVRLNYFMSEWWNLTLWTPSGSQVLSVANGFAYFDDRMLSLNAGTYRIRADADVSDGKAGNALVQFQIVPAPTSLAVIGVVSVFAARRRR